MHSNSKATNLQDRLLDSALRILAADGASALQARALAKEAQVSTMAVYSTFGGMPELLRAVAEHGHQTLATAFESAPTTDDPVTDVFQLALVYRALAQQNPYLYEMMFGLSSRSPYRAIDLKAPGPAAPRSPGYRRTFEHLTKTAARLIASGRARPGNPPMLAAQLWTFVHGFVSLELAGHFDSFEDCVRQLMLPMAQDLAIGFGDTPVQAAKSLALATQ